ncbi:MAG TPA: mechanosensitive ion channel domain-containing protein [Steroidobacteraceae bacterium]|nr:mechanosensitive ion channel domain-containing protein [Steroidobacteraceae bacterium]
MPRRVGLLAAALPALALWWSGAILGQDAAATDAAAKPAPETIAQADIPVRADADERFARDVIQRSTGRDPTAKFEPRLEALGKSVREQSQLFKRDELKLLSVRRLESLERHWKFYGKQLQAWRRDLQQATGQYAEDAAELARRRTLWEATRTAADTTTIAPALGGRIDFVMAQLALAEQAVSGPIDKQIKLGRRASAVGENIEAGQRAVAAAITYIDSRLMQLDAPPIWELWRDQRGSDSALLSMQAGLAVERQFMDEYSAAHANAQQLFRAFQFALLPLLVWLSFRSRKLASDDPEIQASTRVLRRPISSWLVLALLATLVFKPDAPILVHEVALLLALIPVLRLLPPAVYAVLGPWPYVATGLYLLERLSFLVVANAFYHRVYLLFLTLLTLALLVWLLWRSRPAGDGAPRSTRDKVLRGVGYLGIATMAVSAVSNVFGNVSLAEMLTAGLIDSGYVGLVLFAGVTVLSSVSSLLLARRASSRFRIVTQHAGPLLRGFTKLLRLAAFAGWVVITLNEFRIYRPISDALRTVLSHPLNLGQVSLTLGGVLLFGLSVYLAFWVAKTVRLILQDDLLPKMSLPRGVGNSISSLSYYALLMAGLFFALAAAGFEVSQLAIVVGALSVGIGFGLQNVVNNFVSGLILMFERPIQPGDVVEVSGTSGKVREIGMRATTLSTFEGADVVVPNGMLLNEKLINWTLSDMDRRLEVNVGVAYGSDPRRVMDLLMEVSKSTPGVAATPEPAIVFTGFGPSSLDFSIRAWTNTFGEWVNIRSELAIRVHDALQDAGISIPFPQQDVHVRSIAPEAGAALSRPSPPPDPVAAG